MHESVMHSDAVCVGAAGEAGSVLCCDAAMLAFDARDMLRYKMLQGWDFGMRCRYMLKIRSSHEMA
jgi:hypothetical protein